MKKKLKQHTTARFLPEAWAAQSSDLQKDDGTGPTPGTLTGTTSQINKANWKPGLTRELDHFVGYRRQGYGYQFVIETERNGEWCYDLRSGSEIGKKAKDGYLGLEEKSLIGDADNKYAKDNGWEFKEIQGVTSKPFLTRKNNSPRFPITYVFAVFTSKNGEQRAFVSRTALRKLLGRHDADAEIEDYYSDRSLTPPWSVEPVSDGTTNKSSARLETSSATPQRHKEHQPKASDEATVRDQLIQRKELEQRMKALTKEMQLLDQIIPNQAAAARS